MRGSIRKRKLNDGSVRYDARYRVGSKCRERTFRRKKEAEAFLDKTAASIRIGAYVDVAPVQMREVFNLWLEDLETRVALGGIKPSTATTYRCNVRVHLAPAFGGFRTDKFTPRAVAKWRNGLAKRVGAGELAPKTANNIINQLHAICTWARSPAQGYLGHDPLIGQTRFRQPRREATFLDDDEITALLVAAAELAEDNAIVHVAMFGGLRRGELFALRWSDVERNGGRAGRLRVRRSIHHGVITRPKTATSERVVDVPRRVLDALERHREAGATVGGDFIFQTTKGTPIDPDNWYSRRFAKLRAAAELPAAVTLHSLRHTYASLLIRQDENVMYVSRQLGHASTAFTLDRYGHLFQSTSTRAMDRLDTTIQRAKQRQFEVVEGAVSA